MFFWITRPTKDKARFQPFWESGCHLGSITSRCSEKEPALLQRRPDSPEFQPRCHLPPNELTWCLQSGWKWSLLKNITKEEKNTRTYLSQSEQRNSLLLLGETQEISFGSVSPSSQVAHSNFCYEISRVIFSPKFVHRSYFTFLILIVNYQLTQSANEYVSANPV